MKTPVREVTQYATSDNRLHTSKQDAEIWQAVLDLAKWLENNVDVVMSKEAAIETAKAILMEYILTPRK